MGTIYRTHITLEFIEKMNSVELKELVLTTRTKNMANIIDSVSYVLKICVDDIYSKSRLRHLVDARRLCYVLIREIYNYPLLVISKHFGKNHATIIHQLRVHETLKEYDKAYSDNYLEIKNTLVDDSGFNSQRILLDEKSYYLQKLNEINDKLIVNE